MSLLSIIQDAADEIGLSRPLSVLNNADATVRTLLAYANREGKELARRHDWPVLNKLHQFTTAAGVEAYPLPADFDRIVNQTAWDRTNHWEVPGPLTPQEWQFRKSAIVSTGPWMRFRIRGNGADQFYLDPEPTGSFDLVFEYQSRHWCRSSGGAGQDRWLADTDVGVLSEDLITMGVIWRFLQGKGLDYAEAYRSYTAAVDRNFAQAKGARVLDLAGPRRDIFIGYDNVPQTGFG